MAVARELGRQCWKYTHLRWLLLAAAATPFFSQHARQVLPQGAVPHRNSHPRLLIHCMVQSRRSSGQPSSCTPPRAYPFKLLSSMPFPPWDSAILFSHTYPLTILTSEIMLSC